MSRLKPAASVAEIRLAESHHGLAGRALACALPASAPGRMGRSENAGWRLGGGPFGDRPFGDRPLGSCGDPLREALARAPGSFMDFGDGVRIWLAADGDGILYRLDGTGARILGLPISLGGDGVLLDPAAALGALECGPGPWDEEQAFIGWAEAWFGLDGARRSRALLREDPGDHPRWSAALDLGRRLVSTSAAFSLADMLGVAGPARRPLDKARLDPARAAFVLHPRQLVWLDGAARELPLRASALRLAMQTDPDPARPRLEARLRAAGWTPDAAGARFATVIAAALNALGADAATPFAAWDPVAPEAGAIGQAFSGRPVDCGDGNGNGGDRGAGTPDASALRRALATAARAAAREGRPAPSS